MKQYEKRRLLVEDYVGRNPNLTKTEIGRILFNKFPEQWDSENAAIHSAKRYWPSEQAQGSKTFDDGPFNVLVIGDTHCPVMRDDYVPFLQTIATRYNVDRVVHIGDLVDNCALSFHLKKPRLKDPVREYELSLIQIEKLRSAFPKVDWLIGNHDALPYRWCTEVGIPESMMRAPGEIWNTGDWVIHPRFSELVIDGVIYQHGDKGKGGQRICALANAKESFRSVVQGHFHGQAGVEFYANSDYRVFGMQVGCGIDHKHAAMEYGQKFTRKPILGCGVVLQGRTAIFEPMPL